MALVTAIILSSKCGLLLLLALILLADFIATVSSNSSGISPALCRYYTVSEKPCSLVKYLINLISSNTTYLLRSIFYYIRMIQGTSECELI